ncbi:Prolyl endopeptidase [Echinococcus granulosus]|uniref:Prolyl endopeptidase n=1 Tax=Echinococcus granulosus TaxID=6210 RepID=W6UI76_ECHGR|nr:Prolyl endopeptidase [Echinococcus granulosus]EUB60801.1 Prolyl endopeptidase [Echinococcus granulosus]
MVGDYPVFHKDDTVVDDFFGLKVSDPYRWLENPDSDKTRAFVDAQNATTNLYLNSCPYREQIRSKIAELWDYEKYQCIFKRGQRYFYFYNSGLQNQPVLYVMDNLKGRPLVFFDPNAFSEDGLVSLNAYGFSKDGEYFAYGLSNAGSDWVTIRVRKVATGEDLEDKIERVKFPHINWTIDNKGFFYGCYPDAALTADGTETDSNENQKLMYHRLGQPQSEDVLCVEWPDNPKLLSSAEVTDCGRYVFITVHAGCDCNNLLYFVDLEKINYDITGKLNLTPILDKFEAVFDYITNDGRKVIIQTDLNAPMFKLIAINLDDLNREKWIDLIPHNEHCLLDWTACVNRENLVVCYMKDVCHQLSVHSLDTGMKIFYQFVSFLTPGIIYSYDLTDTDAKPEVVFRTKVKGLDLSSFEAKQVFYSSKDGTRVPMFILHRRDFVADGSAPCLLYGYGGFRISLNPFYSLTNSMFLQNFNGVAVVANIRGGGEYGEKWHTDGKVLNKQNSYDDFIAAAEFLVKNKYTKPHRLVIEGGSNGGLLVSVCTNQRPDLFGATICLVPVTDMLRFHRFTIGHAWQSDYGDVSKEEVFRYLMTYSPLHNIRRPSELGVQYPAVLVLTSDHDDRVAPLHSLKYIATLQEVIGRTCPSQTNPLLLRVETNSGHGAGKPTSKKIDELADIFAFIQVALNLTWQP